MHIAYTMRYITTHVRNVSVFAAGFSGLEDASVRRKRGLIPFGFVWSGVDGSCVCVYCSVAETHNIEKYIDCTTPV